MKTVSSGKPTAEDKTIRRIVLTGFMGSGKSTVGPLLAMRLGWRFVDADDALVSQLGMTIADFFTQHGEPAFRERERHTIAQLVQEDALVLSLGGGAIEAEVTRELLLNSPGTLLVHLEAALETALDRTRGTEGTRPVLADAANLQARYERRLPLYRTAHLSVVVDSLTPEEVVESILQRQAVSI
jgi:shikimate kinase